MDIGAKIVMGMFVLWAAVMLVGLLIALMPVILAIVGFVLTVAILSLLGRLVASWFY